MDRGNALGGYNASTSTYATGLLDNKLPPSEMDEKVPNLDTVGDEPEFFDE